MTGATARDFCAEALASAGLKTDDSTASARDSADGSSNTKSSDEFTMDPKSGLTVKIKKGVGKNVQTVTVWLAGPFEIVGRVRDPKSEGWARLLHWRDDDGHSHEHPISDADLHSDPSLVCATLASLGLRITTGPARAHLVRYLNRVDVAPRVTILPRTGWHDVGSKRIFALPGRVADGDEKIIIAGAAVSPYEKAGSLRDWQDSIGKLVLGHTRPMLAVAKAFEPPLLKLVAAEGGGFNFRGPSSIGKTTALCAGASVWGRADQHGIIRTWRGTANGLESTAALFSDMLLPLDELGVASGQEVGNIVYSLASGIGKQRAQRDGSPRPPNVWRVSVLSTGELGISDKIREAGGRVRAGQEIRIVDIDADARKGFGIFDHGGPESDSGKLAAAIKQAAVTYYGTAGPAFVDALMNEGIDNVTEAVRAAHDELTKRFVAGAGNGQLVRAAQRFALCATAAELAIQLGILPWPPQAVTAAAEELFMSWRSDRGDDPGEIRAAIAQIRTVLERHGDSRFDPVNRGLDIKPVSDRLGWWRGDGDDRQWLIPPGVWREVFCCGFDPKTVAGALAERGMLLKDAEGKFSRSERIPACSKSGRVYVLTATVLTDDRQEVGL
jgi:putative DNA primase/helicase